jgi:intraflagellar transport protein 172
LVCGTLTGAVRLCQLKHNKTSNLYKADAMTVSSCSSPDGTAFLTGHMDGTVFRFHFASDTDPASHSLAIRHTCPPTCLAWGNSIMCAGSDAKVRFYDDDGAEERTFDYSDDDDCKGFTACAVNTGGESMILGGFDEFRVFSHSAVEGSWLEASKQHIPNLYTVTALGWKTDGSRVALGTLCGLVDMYDAYLKRVSYKGKFEFTHVSPSQVIVKRITTGTRIVLRSTFHCEIGKIAVFRDR